MRQLAAEWRAARAQATALLRNALAWDLPPPRWRQVQDAVADMAAAAAARDIAALRQAAGYLDLCGPDRVATRLGSLQEDTARRAAPMQVRERIAELVDALSRDDPQASDEPGPDPAPRS